MMKKSKIRKILMDNQYNSFIKNKLNIISFTVIIIFFWILNSLNYSISDQAYFYTLSTISQTLAALIGIISIFIIYRLQLLKSEKSQYMEQLRYLTSKDWFIEKFPFFKFEDDEYLEKNIDIVLEAIKSEFTQDQHEIRRIALLLKLNTLTTSLNFFHFSHPFRIGAVTIIISIFLLPFGSIILPENNTFPIFNSTTAIGTAVALSTYCVISIIESLVNLLKSEYH